MAEFLQEIHTENEHYSLVRLAGKYTAGKISEVFVHLSPESVIFSTLKKENGKLTGKELALRADVIDEFFNAWTAFKENTTEWLQFEAWTKEQEAKAEMDRQVAVWKQVEQLAQSIPGLEITAREDERWDEDTDTYVPSQAWNVKHVTLGHGNMYLYNADAVLAVVQEVIQYYNEHVADCEAGEEEGWMSWHSIAEANAKKFLATHRAFMASKTAPLVEQQA